MNKINSFVKQFAAIIQGDSATALAEKAKRQANSALITHVAVLSGDIVSKEDAVASAKERMALATVNNGNAITDRDAYVRGLLNAKNDLTDAEEALKVHKEKIDFLSAQLKALDEEVEA